MTTIQKFFIVAVVAVLSLAACNAELDELPTPTPVDAALQRLAQENAEVESADEPEAVAEVSESEAETESSTESSSSEDLGAVFSSSGCVACHAVTEDTPPGIGPSMIGYVSRAQETIESADYTGEATTVEEYSRESIVNPQIYIVPDYQPVMPATYEDTLSDEQLDQLVDYLQTFE